MRLSILSTLACASLAFVGCEATSTVTLAEHEAALERVAELEASVAALQAASKEGAQKDKVHGALAVTTVQAVYDLKMMTEDHEDRLVQIEALDIAEMKDLAMCEAAISDLGETVADMTFAPPKSPLDPYVGLNEDGDIVFRGTNVRIESGEGASDAAVNGKGNLILGYGETAEVITGSHNLLVGPAHTVDGYGTVYAMGVEELTDDER